MSEPRHELTIVYSEIWFVVKYYWKYNEDGYCTWLDYTVYRIESMNDEAQELTCKEEPFGIGSIKWDGCIEFTTSTDFHLCGWLQVQQYQTLYTMLYEKACEVFKVELSELI